MKIKYNQHLPLTSNLNKIIKSGQENFAKLCCSSGEITAGKATQLLYEQNIIIYSQLQSSRTLTLRPLFLVAVMHLCRQGPRGRPQSRPLTGPCRD